MQQDKGHKNYMLGTSFYPNDSITQLKLVLLSSFLKETPFYEGINKYELDISKTSVEKLKNYLIFPDNLFKSRSEIFNESVNKALDDDFKGTLELAVKARIEFFMRKSPCEIISVAANHKNRSTFNKDNPKFFRDVVNKICLLPTDMENIIISWKNLNNNSIKGFPSFLKRAFIDKINNLSPYQANKYRKATIDVIRICHAHKNPLIKELLNTGKLKLENSQIKWETHKSLGKNWVKTLEDMNWNMPHMAALRNIRGFCREVRDEKLIKKYCKMLEKGVENGKQFPFRYLSAYKAINEPIKYNGYYRPKKIRQHDKEIVKKCIERCIDISIQNHPKLEGDVIVLSDNSGSAWGAFTSTYGKTTVAEIGNISALITALSCTGRGVVGLFGNKLIEYEVDKNKTFLENYDTLSELSNKGKNVGMDTENGIWMFFKNAFNCFYKNRYDHFFCYSDMQAGHGGLYGDDDEMSEKWKWDTSRTSDFINVHELLKEYRLKINPNINAFMVQTAGYNDTILPQNIYRGAIFSGWTGNEVVYAKELIKLWDSL